jgi:serine/threonine protein kinase
MDDLPKSDVEIFTEALSLPKSERAQFTEQACGGDSGLRKRVDALLNASEDVGEFLETPAPDTSTFKRSASATGAKPGDRIGHFKLLEQIGEGGCGVVFLAEQEEPFHRMVALKIIKPGMDTKSVIARFEAERQTLALMDHPNIAKVFDAGATESGHPYFVMELIRGVKITEYCDAFSLSTEERLKLFVQVCLGIQHAHQKGIIHRDIKPSNILVTQTAENSPLPVIIDFGIAKATTNQQLVDKTVFTAFEMLIGTPAYMSPEQAALSSVDLDTRTDIYSLGVLLYELLAGSTPFDTGELLKAGLDEIRRTIREEEPVRPSTRLSKMTDAELTQLAGKRRAEPPALIRTVRGDLDWIAMKTLEKDRSRRYESANGLMMDIQRYLANEPISARPPSNLYRFRKTVSRNKLLFASIAVITTLLVVSLVFVSLALKKERKALIESQQVTKFFQSMLNGVGSSVAHGRDRTMLLEILDQTAERVGKDLTDQPEVEAKLRTIMATLYNDLGNSAKGEEMARRALAIHEQVSGPNSLQSAAALNLLGAILMIERKVPEAERAHSAALAIRRPQLGDENVDTATSLNNLAETYRDERRLKEAEKMARKALEIRMRLLGGTHLDVADSLRNLALIEGYQSRWKEAEVKAQRVLDIRIKRLGEDRLVASALEDLAWIYSGMERFDESQKLNMRAIVIRDKLLGDSHPDVLRNLNSLGQLTMNRGDLPVASSLLKAVLSMQRGMLGATNDAALETICALAKSLQREGKASEAESEWREALGVGDTLWPKDKPERLYALRDFAETLENQRKWQEAEAVWRDSLVLWRDRGGAQEKDSMYTLRKLGISLEMAGKWPQAESVYREALGISRKNGDEDADALVDRDRVARSLMAQKKFVEAQEFLDQGLTSTFVTKPASLTLLISRVNLNGRQAQWQEAAADARLALQHQLTDHYRYHTLAALRAMAGDHAGYQEVCKTLITKFSDSPDPYVAERMVQDCLLLPDSGADLTVMDKLADKAVTVGVNTDGLPYFQACKAMVLYRSGNFADAVSWTTKAVDCPSDFAKAKAYAVMAMAHWRLRHADEAHAALAKGKALAPPADDLGESWVAWVMARISLDEASRLIDPKIYEEKTN